MHSEGKRQRRARKENRHRRWRCWRAGSDVPGGAATEGPWGKRKADRHYGWLFRKHLIAARKTALAFRTPRASREA